MSAPRHHTDTGHDESTALLIVIVGLLFAALVFTLPWFWDTSWCGPTYVATRALPPATVDPPTKPAKPAKPAEPAPKEHGLQDEEMQDEVKSRRVVLLVRRTEPPPPPPKRNVLLIRRTEPRPPPPPPPKPNVPWGIPVVMNGMPVDPRTTQYLASASDAPDLSRLKS